MAAIYDIVVGVTVDVVVIVATADLAAIVMIFLLFSCY